MAWTKNTREEQMLKENKQISREEWIPHCTMKRYCEEVENRDDLWRCLVCVKAN